MNEIPFSRTGSDVPALWACGKCRVICGTANEAKECCLPNVCECGTTTQQKYRTKCDECISNEREERRRIEYDKAPKVKLADYDGPVYDEFSDTYFRDTDSWLEDCYDSERKPTCGWTCHVATVSLDIVGALENALDDVDYEEAYFDNEDELIAFVNEWNSQQSCRHWIQASSVIVVPDKKGATDGES